jgi:N-acetyl-alpha-D-glucosaminyl L-malate synthase BshA
MRIGIICYASVGGSGVVATELAHALAARDHEVHLISSELPFRWKSSAANLSFERVMLPSYPLFHEPQYLLGLTNTLVRVSRERRLDILHAHYAVPHATAAYLAHQILSSSCAMQAPRTVTTLHGTDITLVGSDPSYARVVAFSIDESHGVTAVSESLRQQTMDALGVTRDIRVIPNFLSCKAYRRSPDPALRARLNGGDESCDVVVHVSNFRPVKRVHMVIDAFDRIRQRRNARLLMIGDGPDRGAAEQQAHDLGLSDRVTFLGEQLDLVPWLSVADLFLLPSIQESFGMAALEAMACEVVVVASRVGGLPEIIEDGVTGFLCDPDDVDAMANRSVEVLSDPTRRQAMTDAASMLVRTRYCTETIVPLYERYYQDVTQQKA